MHKSHERLESRTLIYWHNKYFFLSSLLSVEDKSSLSETTANKNKDRKESFYHLLHSAKFGAPTARWYFKKICVNPFTLSLLSKWLRLSVVRALTTIKLFYRRSRDVHSRHGFLPEVKMSQRWGIRKQRIHSENASNVFRPHYAGGIWKQRFYSENASNVFRAHYALEIWKRRFHSENASNVFRPHYAGGIWQTQQSPAILDLCLKKTRARKSRDYRYASVFKMLRCQIVFCPKVFSKSCVFVTDQCGRKA